MAYLSHIMYFVAALKATSSCDQSYYIKLFISKNMLNVFKYLLFLLRTCFYNIVGNILFTNKRINQIKIIYVPIKLYFKETYMSSSVVNLKKWWQIRLSEKTTEFPQGHQLQYSSIVLNLKYIKNFVRSFHLPSC